MRKEFWNEWALVIILISIFLMGLGGVGLWYPLMGGMSKGLAHLMAWQMVALGMGGLLAWHIPRPVLLVLAPMMFSPTLITYWQNFQQLMQ